MKKLALLFSIIVLASGICLAQTSAFTYQGRLASNGAPPANGVVYQFEFKLFNDSVAGGQKGSTHTVEATVQNGVFTTRLDFGAPAFVAGEDRWLEISVRLNGSGDAYAVLGPRQQVNSVPFAVRSLKATNADNATSATNATTADTATTAGNVSGVVALANGGTGSAMQNFVDLTSSQANIGGNKTFSNTLSGNTVNATTQYNIGGSRVFSIAGTNNLFAGINAGATNTTGINNSFVGFTAGRLNMTGGNNSFFGTAAGTSNTSGSNNSFVGSSAGGSNTSGDGNSFVGFNAGFLNTSGGNNSFFGSFAGINNSMGINNLFVGRNAGFSNTSGGNNTIIGSGADVSSGNLSNATAIGAGSVVSQSNSLVLGNGVLVGIGTTAPQYSLHVVGQNIRVENNSAPRFSLNFTGGAADEKRWQNYATTNALNFTALNDAEDVESPWLRVTRGAGTTISSVVFPEGVVSIVGSSVVFGSLAVGGTSTTIDKLSVTGTIGVTDLGAGGIVPLCWNASYQISLCSSSIRYKQNINAFRPGLSLIKQLRPVSFSWRSNNQADMGLVAEEVNQVEPLLTNNNNKGEIEGVKYDRVGVVLINAVKEQQAQIEQQQTQIKEQQGQLKRQQAEIDALKKFICAQNPTAEICQPKN